MAQVQGREVSRNAAGQQVVTGRGGREQVLGANALRRAGQATPAAPAPAETLPLDNGGTVAMTKPIAQPAPVPAPAAPMGIRGAMEEMNGLPSGAANAVAAGRPASDFGGTLAELLKNRTFQNAMGRQGTPAGAGAENPAFQPQRLDPSMAEMGGVDPAGAQQFIQHLQQARNPAAPAGSTTDVLEAPPVAEPAGSGVAGALQNMNGGGMFSPGAPGMRGRLRGVLSRRYGAGAGMTKPGQIAGDSGAAAPVTSPLQIAGGGGRAGQGYMQY